MTFAVMGIGWILFCLLRWGSWDAMPDPAHLITFLMYLVAVVGMAAHERSAA